MGDEGIADTARRAIEGVIGSKPQVSSCFFVRSCSFLALYFLEVK